MDKKYIKNVLTGIGLLFLIIGQFFILSGSRTALGIIFTVICALLFGLAFTEKFVLIMDLSVKLTQYIKNIFTARPKSAPAAAVKGKAAKSSGPAVKGALLAAAAKLPGVDLMALLQKFGSEGFKFFVPKWALFALVAVMFAAAQFFFFTGSLMTALLMLVAAAVILAATIVLKTAGINVNINLGSGLKVLSMVSGIILIIIGWIMLLSRTIATEQWGVAFTIPGCILAYLALPKSGTPMTQEQDNKSDILFLNSSILNNYIVKAVLLILTFISLRVGYTVMQNQDYNMYSMIFYGIAIVLLFFSLPLFNFAEKAYDNKMVDIAKLVFAAAAVFIAYTAQKDFVQNRINDGLVKYVVAAFIFIFAFPIYSSKIQEEKEPFPLKWEIIFLVAIMIVGLYLRLHELDSRPFGLENDEAGGYTARLSKHGAVTLPLSVGNFGLPLHIVQLFIVFIGELNRMSIKLLGVSVGWLSIPMMYFFIRYILNPRSAIFATTLFTFLRWNLHFSRSGHGYVFSNAVEILAIYFLLKAIETRKKFIWLLAGFCVGLTWHGIMTAFLLIVPIGLYFVISAFSHKDFLRSNLVGIFAFLFGFWMFGSMIVHNFFLSSSIYFGRVHEVSVFSKDPNAPSKNPAKGIVENTRLVLEMFNGQGDSRQRNSGGQPYEPTIDFTSSMIFAVGFIYAIYYSKFYLFFIMVMIFFSQAAGSIFSIEAPSAMRAVGAMIPVVFFIAFIFDKLWLALRRVFGKKLEAIYLPLLLAVFLVPIIKDNYYQYFGRWVGGMDELTTATGLYTKKLGDKWRIMLFTNTYYPGHPPFKINREGKANTSGTLTTAMTFLHLVDTDNFAMLFHYDTWQDLANVKNLYFPESKVEEVDHTYFNKNVKKGEGFGMFAKVVLVTNDELKKKRGLTGTYSFGGPPVQNEMPVFKPEDSAKVPYSVTWKGDFLAPYYGRFMFTNSGNVKFGLVIDGKSIAPGADTLLATGFHKIAITAKRNSGPDSLALNFKGTGLSGFFFRGTENVKLDEKYLYNFRVVGLHGYYFNGNKWDQQNKDSEVIDASIWFDGGVFTTSACWKGTIDVPDSGEYFINTSVNGYARIVMDGNRYCEQSNGRAPDQVADYFKDRPMQQVPSFKLTKGRHKIAVYSLNSNILHLMWNKPGQPSVPVPIGVLEPDFEISQN